MNSRRAFFKQLATSLVAISAPTIFIPKLIEAPIWKASANKWLPNSAWVEAPYEISYFNYLPYYMAKMQLVRNTDYKAWVELLENKTWPSNMGDTIRAI